MTTERKDMEAALEAVLFVSAEPISRRRLLEIFSEAERPAAEEALAAVLARYDGDEGRGVMVDEAAGGIRLVTRPEVHDWLRRFFESSGGRKLSMGALETLAIVAYRQPVTAPEIQELRSVNPSGVLKTLLERRLVRIAGRKQVVGKPFLYTTTRDFLVHFGLGNLKELPPLEEFEEALAAEGEGLGDLLPGTDQEEQLAREAAAAEEAQTAAEERAEERAEVEAAAALEEIEDSSESPQASGDSELTEAAGDSEPTEAAVESGPPEAVGESGPPEASGPTGLVAVAPVEAERPAEEGQDG